MCSLQVFFCGRSEYFRALLRDPFSESSRDCDVPVITLRGLTAPVFVSMVHYVYQNTAAVRALQLRSYFCCHC